MKQIKILTNNLSEKGIDSRTIDDIIEELNKNILLSHQKLRSEY